MNSHYKSLQIILNYYKCRNHKCNYKNPFITCRRCRGTGVIASSQKLLIDDLYYTYMLLL